jgi:membrane protease YdiL (CAAX protease family)
MSSFAAAPEQADDARRPVAGVLHTAGLIVLVIVWAYVGLRAANQMRGDSMPSGGSKILLYLPTFVFEWILFAYIAIGLRRRGIRMREITGRLSTGGMELLRDIGLAVLFWPTAIVILGGVGYALHISSKLQASVKFLLPQSPAEMAAWVLLSVTAGICEETIFRGYLQRQFIAWTGSAPVGVLLSAALFGVGHMYQGARQTVLIGVYGVLFGILAETRRSLRPGMIAHAWQDTFSGIAGSLLAKRLSS